MLIDKHAKLGDAQAITDADAYTTDTYDLGNVTPKRKAGAGEALSLVFIVTTKAAGDSASFTDTFDFMAVQSANANLSSHDVMIQRRVPGSELVAGKLIEIPLPSDRPTKQYIGGRVEIGTGDTVSVTSFIVPREFVPALESYAKGYAV